MDEQQARRKIISHPPAGWQGGIFCMKIIEFTRKGEKLRVKLPQIDESIVAFIGFVVFMLYAVSKAV